MSKLQLFINAYKPVCQDIVVYQFSVEYPVFMSPTSTVSSPRNVMLNFIIRSLPAESWEGAVMQRKATAQVSTFGCLHGRKIQAQFFPPAAPQFRALQSSTLMIADGCKVSLFTRAL